MARAKAKAAAAIHIPVQVETPVETPMTLARSEYLVRVVGGLTVFAFSLLLGGMLFISWYYGSSPNVQQVATPVYSEIEQ